MKKNLALIYVPCPSQKVARQIAKHLLKKKIIACANILGPSQTLYFWQGKLVQEKEFILIGKTKRENFKKAQEEIEKIHPYSVPCIACIFGQSNQKYFHWLLEELKKKSDL